MPEGVEVFYYTQSIADSIVHNTPVTFTLYREGNKYGKDKYNELAEWIAQPHRVTRVYSVGKNTFIQSDLTLRIKYGLTGCIVKGDTAPPNTRLSMVVGSGSGNNVYFTDPLNYGDLTLMTASEVDYYISTLGPDIIKMTDSTDDFRQFFTALQLCGGTKPIAALLDNPNCISGIGNYMRAEILHLSKTPPLARMRDLTQVQLRTLYRAVLTVRDRALEANKKGVEYPFVVYRNPEASTMEIGRGKLWYFPNK